MKAEDVLIVGKEAQQADMCVCWRYLGQRLPSGTRVDLRCFHCKHRVAADSTTVRLQAGGARVVCQVCLENYATLGEMGHTAV